MSNIFFFEMAKTFAELGVIPEIVKACDLLSFAVPTEIQVEAIPVALEGRDIIGLAQTGSGKVLYRLIKVPFVLI